MRILRSQYLKLLHSTTSAANNRPHKQQEQKNSQRAPPLHSSYNLRKSSRGKNEHCFDKNYNNNSNGATFHYTSTVSGYALRQTQSRTQRVNSITRNVIVTRGIAKRTTCTYKRSRRDSGSSTTSYYSRKSSSDSSTSSKSSSCCSDSSTSCSSSSVCYSASASSPSSYRASIRSIVSSHSHGTSSSSSSSSTKSSSLSSVSNDASSGYETLNRSRQQVATDNECVEKEVTHTNFKHIHIKFSNVPTDIGNINVNVEFTKVSPQWLSQVYNSYENNFWIKIPRDDLHGTKKCSWYYQCQFCQKSLSSFYILKSHLNIHLELYPYVCKICSKKYARRGAITRHLKSIHKIYKENYDLFIGQ
ncbi:uncharacterized protein [Musca autumnalis]|uniref:uncharacterized protein n=1 Tax=Musca autumnalis TaxID=221902 RepID=UPI003CF1AA70